jgi:transcriptional regulator with XRE-family HTH domain
MWYTKQEVKNVTIYEKLKQRRLELDMTLQEVADILGTGKPTVSRYENGIIDINFSTLKKLAKVYNIKLQDIVAVEDEVEKKEPEIPKGTIMLARGMTKLSDDDQDLLKRLVESMSKSGDKEIQK